MPDDSLRITSQDEADELEAMIESPAWGLMRRCAMASLQQLRKDLEAETCEPRKADYLRGRIAQHAFLLGDEGVPFMASQLLRAWKDEQKKRGR